MKKSLYNRGKLPHVLLQSLRHFNNFDCGDAEKKKLFQRTFILHLEKNDQSVERSLVVIGVPPMEQEDFGFLLKKNRFFM